MQARATVLILARLNAGRTKAARVAIMPITTRSSKRVKPFAAVELERDRRGAWRRTGCRGRVSRTVVKRRMPLAVVRRVKMDEPNVTINHSPATNALTRLLVGVASVFAIVSGPDRASSLTRGGPKFERIGRFRIGPHSSKPDGQGRSGNDSLGLLFLDGERGAGSVLPCGRLYMASCCFWRPD